MSHQRLSTGSGRFVLQAAAGAVALALAQGALASSHREAPFIAMQPSVDGTEDNAGALLAPDSLARAQALGLSPKAMLARNDGYGFFDALGDLVVTGPTRTNVNDFRALLITEEAVRAARQRLRTH